MTTSKLLKCFELPHMKGKSVYDRRLVNSGQVELQSYVVYIPSHPEYYDNFVRRTFFACIKFFLKIAT